MGNSPEIESVLSYLILSYLTLRSIYSISILYSMCSLTVSTLDSSGVDRSSKPGSRLTGYIVNVMVRSTQAWHS